MQHDRSHILFVEVDHSLLKRNIFGLVGFAKLLENLSVKQENNISENTEDMLRLFFLFFSFYCLLLPFM